ncbi:MULTISPECIES: PHB depolymerase family esterase [unclassified Yoonia]|uniref:extracellular catalytic domain type 1 short-chain-length polyhydroxyalkanoate depolymerase n=1 Tax=unclassified Yoonia TaxID=2629118 RepID=UPI002AFE4DF8|nr:MULTISPECIES: PHB depolymerase family esterase [unclassified Yoonia]
MPKTLAANMRRMQRMMRPAKLTKKSQSILIASAFSPFGAAKPKKTKTQATAAGQALGLMVNNIRAAQGLMPGASKPTTTRAVAPTVPKGAQYLSRQHRSAQGARGYKLYLPASAPKKPKGLILMLHGCGQDPDDFALGTHMNAVAEKHGLAVAYPAQTRKHNAGGCWNWFGPAHQIRGVGEPAILASLTRKLMRELGVTRDNVYVAGLSAGGAMAAILVDVYPDVFAAAGIHSGLARGAARDVSSAMGAMRSGAPGGSAPAALRATYKPVRRIIFQGDNDGTVHLSNAQHLVTAALGDDPTAARITSNSVRKIGYTRSDFASNGDLGELELWVLKGAGHAWSGGRVAGSYTDHKGPDASTQMVRFFLAASR